MFIPLPIRFKDGRDFHATPLVNGLLVAVNVLVFFFGWMPYVGPGTGVFSVVTYSFGHVGAWHLIGNMLTLLVFGTPVNRRLGNGWYLIVYFSIVLALGIFAKVVCPTPLMGASGVIFAIIAMALILFPSAMIEFAYVAIFPFTLVTGVLSRPKHWVGWLIRWDTFELRASWGLLVVPLMEIWGLVWWGWNWSNLGHLMGLACGVAAILSLPSAITMSRRSRVGFMANA